MDVVNRLIHRAPVVLLIAAGIAMAGPFVVVEFKAGLRVIGPRSSRPAYFAIRSVKDWRDWQTGRSLQSGALQAAGSSDIAPDLPPLPADIDLSRDTLIVANSGVKASSGFDVFIQSVTESDEIRVSLLETTPGTQCPRMSELTYPEAFALIPKTSKPIRFDVTTATIDCPTHRSIAAK
jgi:hypothetical protein